MQVDYIKLRKKNRAAESTNKALQDLCAKQRLELDAARDEASQAGQQPDPFLLLRTNGCYMGQSMPVHCQS